MYIISYIKMTIMTKLYVCYLNLLYLLKIFYKIFTTEYIKFVRIMSLLIYFLQFIISCKFYNTFIFSYFQKISQPLNFQNTIYYIYIY